METKGCNLATKSVDRGCVVRIAISDPSWLSSRVRGFFGICSYFYYYLIYPIGQGYGETFC